MRRNANHLINAQQSPSAWDAALSSRFSRYLRLRGTGPAKLRRGRMVRITHDHQEMAAIREEVTQMREKSIPNEAKKPHWRYQKPRSAQKTNPNEPICTPTQTRASRARNQTNPPPRSPSRTNPISKRSGDPPKAELLPVPSPPFILALSVPCPSGARACWLAISMFPVPFAASSVRYTRYPRRSVYSSERAMARRRLS